MTWIIKFCLSELFKFSPLENEKYFLKRLLNSQAFFFFFFYPILILNSSVEPTVQDLKKLVYSSLCSIFYAPQKRMTEFFIIFKMVKIYINPPFDHFQERKKGKDVYLFLSSILCTMVLYFHMLV